MAVGATLIHVLLLARVHTVGTIGVVVVGIALCSLCHGCLLG